jgi:LmbE family N-acetylglucosaminyl deacetylase
MKLLLVCAHPDDEILGAGATVARLIKEGAEGHTLILGIGITSRDYWIPQDLEILDQATHRANEIIGIKLPLFLNELADNQFDTFPLLDITKMIEKVVEEIKPNIIFTHSRNDLNIDHRITYQAVITATRPMKDCPVKEIYSFEVPSSTEWEFPHSFSPNVFFDVTTTMQLKLEAMKQYESELREWPHPRSIKGISTLAEYRGMQAGMYYAEAFEAVRILR